MAILFQHVLFGKVCVPFVAPSLLLGKGWTYYLSLISGIYCEILHLSQFTYLVVFGSISIPQSRRHPIIDFHRATHHSFIHSVLLFLDILYTLYVV